MLSFDNSYARLPQDFYEVLTQFNAFNPELLVLNDQLCRQLDIDLTNYSAAELAQFFSFSAAMPGSTPVAMAYAGHQFGHFVPQLGDGRALLLGEFLSKTQTRYDIHLKGSGRTRFSRRGDGNSALGPALREYVVSECMAALEIPTTRSLAVVRTNESVMRDGPKPGAVLVRVAQGHIRVGTFQYFAARGDSDSLKILADYAIQRFYPSAQSYFEFWQQVAQRQMALVARWMSVGFIHGVMNTDNVSIVGETIDFGPCAFLDQFSMNKVFSSIDQNGRYAYGNQPRIAVWNLARFAECLLELMPEGSAEIFTRELERMPDLFWNAYLREMGSKLGFTDTHPQDVELVREYCELMEAKGLDFTLSFIELEKHFEGERSEALQTFAVKLQQRPGFNVPDALAVMKAKNPLTIARNHKVEQAIAASEQGDDGPFHALVKAVQRPFERMDSPGEFQLPPKPSERVLQTFCGT